MRPLAGIRVLDLSRLLPGPYATRQLAELGADVIKVEDPTGGDYARWYPPLGGDPPTSSIFRELNLGKRSVALDLKVPEAVQALLHLVGTVDVLVDSFRPGVLRRLGLDPEALMAAHPRLIYCALTGFGLTGNEAARAGHDIGYQARAGLLGVGADPARPVLGPVQIADLGGALVAVSGILAALFERERTGKGRVVDTSLTESALAFGAVYFGKDLGGEAPRRGEEMLDGSRPCYRVYSTKDGHLAVGALEPKFWRAFVHAIGLPELEYSAMDGGAAGAKVIAQVEARLSERTAEQWRAVFAEVEACVEVVSSVDEVRRDPQLVARGAFYPDGTTRGPIRVAEWGALEAPAASPGDSPALGAHTREVLEEAGVPSALVEALCGEP